MTTHSKPNLSGAVFHFEAIYVSAAKNKDGYVVRLAVHPDDVPLSLVHDPVGSRYQIAAVRLGDDEMPVPTPEQRPKTVGQELVQKAGILCREKDFWSFMSAKDEDQCIACLHIRLGVDSRAKLATDKIAQNIFKGLLRDYEATAGRPL